MKTLAQTLTALVAEASLAAGLDDSGVSLEPVVSTNDPRHGDYQSNHAFRVARSRRENPRALAETLKAELPAHPAVASVAVAGPGFLNFTLADAWLAEQIDPVVADPQALRAPIGAGQRVVIDYSSPNIAKRMHVGHLRSTIIGNALHRMYAWLGYEVIADNHIGDWGTQFGKLIVAWREARDEAAYREDAIGELQRLYKLFGTLAESRPELADLARAETAKLQEGDADNLALWRAFVDVSMAEFNGIYERLGVHFDVVHGESFYNDRLGALVDELLKQGIAQPSEGAVIIPFAAEDGPGLENTPLLVRKRDGAALYGTTDLATVEHRMTTWAPARIVYVTDVRQKLHFQQVFAAARKIGWNTDFQHVWFGMLRFADGSIAATRATNSPSVNLIDVLDEAARRAREVVDAKSGHLPESEREAIAEAVGISAVRYADLSQNPQSDIIFDWDKMLSLQGNTAPYVMYAHARCCSILDKAEGLEVGPVRLTEPAERDLALAIARLPEVAATAAASNRPNLLCDYAYGLAGTFSSFYLACPVLKADGELRASRVALVRATAAALSASLKMLGIPALERM